MRYESTNTFQDQNNNHEIGWNKMFFFTENWMHSNLNFSCIGTAPVCVFTANVSDILKNSPLLTRKICIIRNCSFRICYLGLLLTFLCYPFQRGQLSRCTESSSSSTSQSTIDLSSFQSDTLFLLHLYKNQQNWILNLDEWILQHKTKPWDRKAKGRIYTSSVQ